MADRFPLIVDASLQTIKELPANDNLDLSSSGIVGVASIGINTSIPSASLDVVGNVKVSGNLVGLTSIGINTSSPSNPLQVNSGSNLVIVDSSGDLGVGTATAPTKLYVQGNAASNIVGLGTTNATTTLDFTQGNNFSLTLTGNITLANPTGLTVGQSGIILIQQDSVGSRTVGYGSHWDFPSATAPTLTTTASGLDCLTYFVRNTTSIITNSVLGIGTL